MHNKQLLCHKKDVYLIIAYAIYTVICKISCKINLKINNSSIYLAIDFVNFNKFFLLIYFVIDFVNFNKFC